MWRALNKTINPNKSKSDLISRLIIDGKSVTQDKEIAEEMNKFFCSVGPNLAAKLPPSKSNHKSYMKFNQVDSFFARPVDPKELSDLINSLKKQGTRSRWNFEFCIEIIS